MGELCIKQCYDVTPRTKGAGWLVEAILTSDLRDEISRNELAMLTQYDGIAFGGLFYNKTDPWWNLPTSNLIIFL